MSRRVRRRGATTRLRLGALALLASLLGACTSYEAFNGWWAQAATDSVTINGEETSFGEGWFLRVDARGACGIRVGQFQDQVHLRLYRGSARRGVLNLNRSDVIRGQYLDEYGPRDPLQFRLDGARLRLDWWFPGDTQPRVTDFLRVPAPVNPDMLAAAERCR